jgi:hypothetical protein
VLNGLYLLQNYYKEYFKENLKVICVFSYRTRLEEEVQFTFFSLCIDLDKLPQAQFLVSSESSHLHALCWVLVKRQSKQSHM